MKLEDIHQIAVLGAGLMGHGIAQSFIAGGYPVILYDIQESVLDSAEAHIKNSLELFCRADLIESKDIAPALDRLTCTVDLKRAVAAADFITEAIPEDPALKQDIFQRVEDLCRHEAILASNTSSLTLEAIGARVLNKQRLVTTHWFNPPQLVPTVEVVRGKETSDETFTGAYDLLMKIGKVPVKINRELPGFIVNRVQIAMVREVLDLFEQGIASAEDIDRAIKGSIGFRLASIGPMITMDLGGLGLWLKVMENLLPRIRSSTEPPEALKTLVSRGHTGIMSGQGFYDYSGDRSEREVEETIRKRDREFLQRLKNLYGESETGE
jgi:3-hydroxybutyryl-CoA dehydrogenase